MPILLWLICYGVFAVITALWGTFFSYRLDYIALTHAYLVFAVAFPAFLVARVWLRVSNVTLFPVTIITALVWMLILYYFDLYLEQPGSFGLTAALYAITIVYSYKYKIKTLELPIVIERSHMEKAICTTVIASLAFMYYAVVRPAPNDFGSNGITTYFTDQLWHAGNAWTLTVSMPPNSPNLMGFIKTKYHLYTQVMAADLSMMMSIPPSLTSLNYINIIFAALSASAVACFCMMLRFNTLLFALTGLFFLAFTSCVSESYFVGCAIALVIFALIFSKTRLTDMHVIDLLMIAAGIALCTFTKGPLGLLLLVMICMFVMYEALFLRHKIRKALCIVIGISAAWTATYLFYLCNAAASSSFVYSPLHHLPRHIVALGNAFEGAISSLTSIIQFKRKHGEAVTPLLILRETELAFLRVVELSSAFISSAKFFTIGLLAPIFIQNRTIAMPLCFALLGALFYWNMDFYGDEEWFLHSGCFALVIASALLVQYWWHKIESKGTLLKTYLMMLATFGCIFQISVDRYSITDALYALQDKLTGTSLRYSVYQKDRPAITPDLLDALEHIRDHTGPYAHIVHNIGINNNLFRAFPAYVVSGLSERYSCVESLQFVLGNQVENYVSDMSTLTNAKIATISDETLKDRINHVKACYDVISKISNGTTTSSDLAWLQSQHFEIYFLFPRQMITKLKSSVGTAITTVYENKSYGLARLVE